MRNDLYKVERDLRSIAKRYNSVKYSLGLAVLFLMLGGGAFSQEINDGNVTTSGGFGLCLRASGRWRFGCRCGDFTQTIYAGN